MMRVAVLETGAPPESLRPRFGRYPDMFADLIGRDRIEASYDVTAGEMPARVNAHQAYLITGSAAGVHDDLPWIEPLCTFLRETKGDTKLVGICFGHQLMAHAFGGKVDRSPRGWGIGLHEYEIERRAQWMDTAQRIAVPVSHQDQVIVPPPAATVLGKSAFTRFAVLSYKDRLAISFQCHPEFTPGYAAALIGTRNHPAQAAAQSTRSLAEANDCARVGTWLRSFLDEARAQDPLAQERETLFGSHIQTN